jgi:signal transduction histidine kinase
VRLFKSIKYKLIVFTLCISLIPICAITAIYYLNARSTAEKQILQKLTAVVESKKMHVVSFIEAKKGRVIDFSSDGFIRDSLETISQGRYQRTASINLKGHLDSNKKPLDPHIMAIAIVDMDGKIVASTNDAMIGKDVSNQEIFIKSIGKNYGEAYVDQSYYAPYLNASCIFIAAPLTYRYGVETIGIIINAYDLASLSEITTNRVGMGETGEVYIVNNRDKTMLTESRFIEDVVLKMVVDTEPVRRISEGGKGMTAIYSDYRGVPVVGASVAIPAYDWILLAEIDKAEAFASLGMVRFVALVVGGVCAAVAVCGGIIFSISAARPISRLRDATDRFAKGDLDHRVNIANKDEIGDLATSFNNMAHELKNEIAEHKRVGDELSVANRELEAFCYSVSHDLRAPLRGIDGFSKALVEDFADRLDSEGKGYLHRIRIACRRMGQLIDDLLALSRITRRDMRREGVDMSAMVQEIVADLQKRRPERRVEFSITEGLKANVDTQLMQLALLNLLDNAWKFTEKHPHAKIEFGVTQNGKGPVYFVRDDGAGFDMKYVDKIFGAFQRLHDINEFEGTGIGLATVQRIFHRHGGRIWAEGAVEQGATFYFAL